MIMSDRRKREIRDLMAETGMNYTRAARELERRRKPTAQHVVGSAEVGPAPRWVADMQHAADEHAKQMADMQRAADEHATQMAAMQRAADEHAKQMADMQRAADEHAKQMAAIGDSRMLAQMADVQRAADEHAKQMAAIGDSRMLAQMADVQRAADEHAKQMAAMAVPDPALAAINRAADKFAIRFTPPS
jgi:hypothetical protein